MNKLFLFSFFIAFTFKTMSQSQAFQWAKQIGGSANDNGNAIVADSYGNSFVAGSTGGLLGIFVSKFEASGNLSWTKSIYSGYCSAKSIALDKSGNIYLTGYFSGNGDFDPDSATVYELTSNGGGDVFILKLNSLGQFLWVKQIGGTGLDVGHSITVDTSGIYSTGKFGSTADFDPGTGKYNLTVPGNSGIFISKLDPSGKFQWAAAFGGTAYDVGHSIATDKLGNVYTTGIFTDTADFNPGVAKFEMIANNNVHTFILKLNRAGGFMWAKSIKSDDNDNKGCSIATDTLNNVFIGGSFRGEADFNPNSGIAKLYSSFSQDIFIMKLDEAGNFAWAQNIGGDGDDYGNIVTTDRLCNVYISGRFEDKVNFDPLGFSAWLTSRGSSDVFILKMNVDGDVQWVKQMGGNGYDVGNGLATDPSNNVYAIGEFEGIADFNPESPVLNLVSKYESDVFVLKLGSPFSRVKNTPPAFAFIVYPNPAYNCFNIKLQYQSEDITIEVYNSSGILMWSQVGMNQINTINIENYAKDLYIAKVSDRNGLIATKKIIMQ